MGRDIVESLYYFNNLNVPEETQINEVLLLLDVVPCRTLGRIFTVTPPSKKYELIIWHAYKLVDPVSSKNIVFSIELQMIHPKTHQSTHTNQNSVVEQLLLEGYRIFYAGIQPPHGGYTFKNVTLGLIANRIWRYVMEQLSDLKQKLTTE